MLLSWHSDLQKREDKRSKESVWSMYEAARWLREMEGSIDLPAEPSEEEFRLALKSGIILSNVINCILPGNLPKGGDWERVVDSILGLKFFWEKKQRWKAKDTGGSGHSDSPDIMNPDEVPVLVEVCPEKVINLSAHKIGKLHSKVKDLKHTFTSTKEDVISLLDNYQEEINYGQGKRCHDLAQAAASRYRKVLEENRKLYNQVQDLKGRIRVYCRVRPLSTGKKSYASHIEDRTITVSRETNGRTQQKTLNCNKVFKAEATQEAVFEDIQPLVRSVLDGYNVCIIAYGPTGSGKTYTMSGPENVTKESQGLNYRALDDLFLLSEERNGTFRYDFSVQMIEVYNEKVRDLLDEDGCKNDLRINDTLSEGINVPDAKLVPVASRSEVLEQMEFGEKNRAVGPTALNIHSSRSHSCLTVRVRGTEVASATVVLQGCLNLVDLAGSENASKSLVSGDRLIETRKINTSLSVLGNVISGLLNDASHIPYRSSKLTHLLQHSLGGEAKTVMFVHLNPEMEAFTQTLSTLEFAERAGKVQRKLKGG